MYLTIRPVNDCETSPKDVKGECLSMLKKLRLAIFDLDQTLVNTLKRAYHVYNYARKAFGLDPVDWSTFYVLFRDDKLSIDIPEDIQKHFWSTFRKKYCEFFSEEDKPFDGVRDLLKKLKSRGMIIVVTTGRSCPPEVIWDELESYGLSDLVDDVYTAMGYDENEEIPFERSAILRIILDKYKVSPSEAIFVADYLPDMYAGKKVGVLTIGVKTGLKSESLLKAYGADFVLESVADLWDFLRSLGVI